MKRKVYHRKYPDIPAYIEYEGEIGTFVKNRIWVTRIHVYVEFEIPVAFGSKETKEERKEWTCGDWEMFHSSEEARLGKSYTQSVRFLMEEEECE